MYKNKLYGTSRDGLKTILAGRMIAFQSLTSMYCMRRELTLANYKTKSCCVDYVDHLLTQSGDATGRRAQKSHSFNANTLYKSKLYFQPQRNTVHLPF